MLQRRLATVLSLGLVFLLIASTSPAQAGNATPKVYGQTIGNWGLDWWQWLFNFAAGSIPTEQNGNVDCSADQSGEVWYLVGTFLPGPAERTCSIKKGKALFFPLFNNVFWTPLVEGNEVQDGGCIDEPTCRTAVGNEIDTVISWTCTVRNDPSGDDIPCVWSTQVVRAQSDAQPLHISRRSFLVGFGYQPGIRKIAVADGYWVMLDPLPRGRHTLHFTSNCSTDHCSFLDVTYHLTVQ